MVDAVSEALLGHSALAVKSGAVDVPACAILAGMAQPGSGQNAPCRILLKVGNLAFFLSFFAFSEIFRLSVSFICTTHPQSGKHWQKIARTQWHNCTSSINNSAQWERHRIKNDNHPITIEPRLICWTRRMQCYAPKAELRLRPRESSDPYAASTLDPWQSYHRAAPCRLQQLHSGSPLHLTLHLWWQSQMSALGSKQQSKTGKGEPLCNIPQSAYDEPKARQTISEVLMGRQMTGTSEKWAQGSSWCAASDEAWRWLASPKWLSKGCQYCTRAESLRSMQKAVGSLAGVNNKLFMSSWCWIWWVCIKHQWVLKAHTKSTQGRISWPKIHLAESTESRAQNQDMFSKDKFPRFST